MNLKAVDNTLAHLHEVPLPDARSTAPAASCRRSPPTRPIMSRTCSASWPPALGDDLPVSAFPCDGTFPTATAQYEKRNLALDIPVWDEAVCIQCMKCVAICPHATIRAKVYDAEGAGRRAGGASSPPTPARRNGRA